MGGVGGWSTYFVKLSDEGVVLHIIIIVELLFQQLFDTGHPTADQLVDRTS